MDKLLGIYIHIPFCASKCAYCNFYSLAGCDALMPEYQEALLQHIREHAPLLTGYRVDTIYFGGGTPGYYGADRLAAILYELRKHADVIPGAEITAEINPGNAATDDLTKLRQAGFNRLSVGVQCADDGILKSIGRPHTFADAEKTIKTAGEAGFENISADIIYGLPSQDDNSWVKTVERIIALEPAHISCYAMKIEEGTRLYTTRSSLSIPDDDAQADMYLRAVGILEEHCYSQYEISNFAKLGYESRHNMKYWNCDEYLGFGPSAHSYFGGYRFSFIGDVSEYISLVTHGGGAVNYRERITDTESAKEYLMLRLRTVRGISEDEYRARYNAGLDPVVKLLREYETAGWAVYSGGRWKLTPAGFLISNALIAELLTAQEGCLQV